MKQTYNRFALITLACAIIALVIGSSAVAFQLGDPTKLGFNGLFSSPSWSPDGQRLALSGAGYSGLYVTDLFGNMSTVSDAPMSGWRFRWSPDGQSVAFRTRDEIGMGMQLNVAGPDGKSKQISPTLNDMYPATWGKDGLTYRSGDELITVDEDGKVVKVCSLSGGKGLLARVASVAGTMMMSQITGSTFAAFSLLLPSQMAEGASAESGVFTDPDNQIWIVDENGNKKKLLDVQDESGYFNPVESKDGNYAVSGLSGNLYVTNPENGKVVEMGTGCNPTWSPDGKYIIFERTTDNGHELTSSDLWIVSVDGSFSQQLTNTDSIETQPSWSPDGKWVAYVVDGVVEVSPIGQ